MPRKKSESGLIGYSTRGKSIGYVKLNEQGQKTLALLEILGLGRQQVESGKTVPADEAFRRLRARRLG